MTRPCRRVLALATALLLAVPLALTTPVRDATAEAERMAQVLFAAHTPAREGVVILALRSGRGYPDVTFDVATTVRWEMNRGE
jgi:hypothetical protein